MNGSKGTAIVIVALLLTLCVGYMANFEDHETTKTVYEKYSDLDALMYANSERNTSTDVYNSVYNVTGWTGADIPTTATANQYPITPSSTTYDSHSKTVNSSDFTTTNQETDTYMEVYSFGWKTTSSGVYYRSGNTYTDTSTVHGGISYQFQISTATAGVPFNGYYKLQYSINGTNDATVYFDDLKNQITPTDGMKVFVDSGFVYDYSVGGTVSDSTTSGLKTRTYAVSVTGTAYSSASYIVYNWATEKWTVYNSSNENIGTATKVLVSFTGSSTTINYATPVSVPATYADPLAFVPVSDGAVWSNTAYNSTLVNSSVKFLIQTSGYVDFNIQGNTANGGGYFTQMHIAKNSTGNYSINLTYDIGVYDALEIELNVITNTVTVKGVVSVTDAVNYTVQDAPVTFTFNTLSVEWTSIKTITCADGSASMRIEETRIYTDPDNILWNDFNVNLASYFPSIDNSMRVMFNGYVATGQSLTINGNTYTVTDGKITVPVESTEGATRYKAMSIDGLAIDYTGGHTYLCFTQANNTTVDLGETSTYVIAGAGTWYFSTAVYTIGTEASTSHDWVCEWGLDTNAAVLILLAFIGVGCGIGLYFRNDSFGVLDWAIVLISGIIALSLVVL